MPSVERPDMLDNVETLLIVSKWWSLLLRLSISSIPESMTVSIVSEAGI